MPAERAHNPVVADAMANVSRLATLPQTAAKILKVVDDPETTSNELEQIVVNDAVLSARVLKVVNSPFYGMPASINSIQRAIVVLGMPGLKNIVLAASLAKLFRSGRTQNGFDPKGPWRHSTAVGVAARTIAKEVGGDAEEMFLLGLMHDVGTVIQLQAMTEKFARLVQARSKDPEEPYADAEQRIIGATHEEIGLALCEKWNFPETIQNIVGHHHSPNSLDEAAQRSGQIIALADRFAVRLGIGYCVDATSEFDEAQALGLSTKFCEQTCERLPAASSVAASVFA